jgi:hypothetical protein
MRTIIGMNKIKLKIVKKLKFLIRKNRNLFKLKVRI